MFGKYKTTFDCLRLRLYISRFEQRCSIAGIKSRCTIPSVCRMNDDALKHISIIITLCLHLPLYTINYTTGALLSEWFCKAICPHKSRTPQQTVYMDEDGHTQYTYMKTSCVYVVWLKSDVRLINHLRWRPCIYSSRFIRIRLRLVSHEQMMVIDYRMSQVRFKEICMKPLLFMGFEC